MKPNYSIATSLPDYRDNVSGKRSQCDTIRRMVHENKGITLKQIEELTGLPQSTVAGRVNDLIKDGLVRYDGIITYGGRSRKRIVPIIYFEDDTLTMFHKQLEAK